MKTIMEAINGSLITNYFNTTNIDRGDKEKILAMVTLGIGSFLTGMLPTLISEQYRRKFPLTISSLLCFGAGILLATALVHILPEVRSQMSSNYAEISLCGGFFIIYFIDEFIHYFFGGSAHNISTLTHEVEVSAEINRNYGAIDSEREPLLAANSNTSNISHTTNPELLTNAAINNPSNSHNHSYESVFVHGHSHRNESVPDTHLCHGVHTEPCARTLSGTFGLFVALSIHSAIEGIAIGVQNSPTKVLFLLGAVACHKFVMSFCLGLVFRTNSQTSLRSQFIAIIVFSSGAVIGIGIGMLIIDLSSNWTTTVVPIIQALAGGTLLYVTVCEVIPREKAQWHQSPQRLAGFTQFFAICCGFVAMTVINFYVKDDDT